ncbi:MAG: pilus assembly protein TadG-related protein [Actinomycetes bacterium]
MTIALSTGGRSRAGLRLPGRQVPGARGTLSRGRWRSARGAGFIWFTLIALPFAMLSLALSTDFTRSVMVGHQMRNVADAAAVAAAWQIQPGTAVLDEDRATAAALDTVCAYTGQVAGVEASPEHVTETDGCAHGMSADVVFDDENDPSNGYGTGYRSVTVTVYYSIPNLIFPAYFGGFDNAFSDVMAQKTAVVCIPGDTSNFTGGNCVRPADQ